MEAPRAAALMEMDGLVEEFLLRLPPDDPASLVRAALVCKLWRRILAARGFRRRFCELHPRPPMLGLLVYLHKEARLCFTPTSSFRPRNAELRGWCAIDSRHSRVLFSRSLIFNQLSPLALAVWDPISGDWVELPELPAPQNPIDFIGGRWNAAVLCASNNLSKSTANPSSACDSIDCHLGHFLVVVMGTYHSQHSVYLYTYSSQASTWSESTSVALDPLGPIKHLCPIGLGALAGNALCFMVSSDLGVGILKYDLGMQEISCVNIPPDVHKDCHTLLLTTTEFGGLGIAGVERSRLHLWEWEAGPGGHLGWAPSRVIELNTMLPANSRSIDVVAFLHGLGAFLVSTNDGVFSVDLESNQARKVCEGSCDLMVVPYMCFFTPGPDVALTYTGERPGASVPNV